MAEKPDNASTRRTDARSGLTMTTTNSTLTATEANLSGGTAPGGAARARRVVFAAVRRYARATKTLDRQLLSQNDRQTDSSHLSDPSICVRRGQLRMRRLYDDDSSPAQTFHRALPCHPTGRPGPAACRLSGRRALRRWTACRTALDSIEINQAFYGVRTSGFC